ncbi:unnamed protein product [Polarella glacialis]|uniref:Uncharacterized protein n=1 Tax=Polarella glacialis TaxID=89957 RepID=A0A813JL30_POLGL|nr:unnamed protein product [Polarella glacialis]|mmetsp:Transcript_37606/g.60635  ORF Transcript_37606/g.60635 Transcript_37606/m.60635 type:complete len:389 (-) Transcript_37606:240-1406(-)
MEMAASEADTQKLLEAGQVKAQDPAAAKAALAKDLAAAQAALAQGMGSNSETSRANNFVAGLDFEDDTPLKQGIRFAMKYLVKPAIIIIMVYVWIAKQLYKVYKLLPTNIIQMVFGGGLCFFGGEYFMSIAAAEAFRNFGGKQLLEELAICWDQALLVEAANVIDDKLDDDKNGIVDVEELGYNELINRKAKMAMIAITRPDRLMNATQYLFSAYIAVIATLKMQFARTVAIALGIAEMLELPACQVFGPVLAMLYGKDLQHWVSPTIITTIKVIAVVVASYIQAIISAFYSGLRGGRLVGEGFVNAFGNYLPDSVVAKKDDPEKPGEKIFDPDNSYLDEIIGFPLAAAGFYFQFTSGFTGILAFPFNLVMLPCTIVEWILRWNVFIG